MTNLYEKLFENKYKFIVLLVTAIIFILYQIDRNIRQDDDYIGEQVYWLIKDGLVRTECMRGFGNIGLENYQSVFHKLFVYNGALFSLIFGWSLSSLHAVSLFYFISFIIAFALFLRANKDSFEPSIFYLVISFMFITYNILYYATTFRPEIMLMALGFISYIFLFQYLKDKKLLFLILSSFFSALCFASHLNGLIFIGAGFVVLLFNKRYREAIIYGLISGITFTVIYFYDILRHEDISYFIWQFKNDPSIPKVNYQWYSPFLKLVNEHSRLLYNEREIPITLLFFFSIFTSRKYFLTVHRNLLIYTSTLVIFMGGYLYSKSPQYLTVYVPFTVLIIALGWSHVERQDKLYEKIIFRTLLLSFVCIHVFFAAKRIQTNYTNFFNTPHTELHHQYASLLPEPHSSLNILAPEGFIFNEIKGFNRIQSLLRYSFFIELHNKPKLSLSNIVDSSYKYNINYILMNGHYINYFNINGLNNDETNYVKDKISIVYNQNNLAIIKLNKN